MLSTDITNYHKLYHAISDKEVNFQIKLSSFINSITRSQQKQFADLISSLSDLYIHGEVKSLCDLPNQYADIRRLYTDGQFSVSKHTPIPNVIMKKDHSFVSLKDCVADFLMRNNEKLAGMDCWGRILTCTSNDDIVFNRFHHMRLFNCRRTISIVRNGNQRMIDSNLQNTLPLCPVFIKFWSDDFDPNKSTKANRQSVWIKTCTIFAADIYGQKIHRTYPISLSKKGCDHEVVEECYSNELHELKFGKLPIMYSRAHTSLVNVHAELFCVMNDQPERRSNLNLGNGNATCHGRFGYIIDCKQVKDKIRSCYFCRTDINNEIGEYKQYKQYNESFMYKSNNVPDPNAVFVSNFFYQIT